MGFLDWFRRPPRIDDRAGLTDYLDSRAAFVVQKGIFDFSRGAAGPHFSQLIKEPAYVEAVDEARWNSYPLALSAVVEMVHGVLLPAATGAMPLAEALQGVAFAIVDRYPVPQAIGAEAWAAARAELGRRVIHIALHPPKAVKDIVLPIADQFFANLPIHQRLRGAYNEIVTNNLRSNLLRMHDDFTRRADVAALMGALDVARERAVVTQHG
jgi:hypothetical protein